MKGLGYLMMAMAALGWGYFVSLGNNLEKQPIVWQPQTWVTTIAALVLFLGGWTIVIAAKRRG